MANIKLPIMVALLSGGNRPSYLLQLSCELSHLLLEFKDVLISSHLMALLKRDASRIRRISFILHGSAKNEGSVRYHGGLDGWFEKKKGRKRSDHGGERFDDSQGHSVVDSAPRSSAVFMKEFLWTFRVMFGLGIMFGLFVGLFVD